jgi:ribosomal protein L11 methyltransferase
MGPDDPLYIYELEGGLYDPEGFFKEDLLAHWREGESHFLFFPLPREDDLLHFLKKQTGVTWVRSHTLSYKDWQGGVLQDILTVGKLKFIPPWTPQSENSEGIILRLDPGVVFGSGTHPTTHDCLQALLWIYEQEQPQKVLDLGTGTGILSLAAVALGAGEVLAVDFNPACIRTAGENAVLNDLQNKITIQEGRAEDYILQPADLVLMNIHFTVIRDLISSKAFYEKKWAIISGLLRSEFLEIKQLLRTPGFKILKEWDSEFTWFTLVGRNISRTKIEI